MTKMITNDFNQESKLDFSDDFYEQRNRFFQAVSEEMAAEIDLGLRQALIEEQAFEETKAAETDTPRRLDGEWTIEIDNDVQVFISKSAVDELTRALEQEILDRDAFEETKAHL